MAANASAHEKRVQRVYGLKPGEYQAMLAAQDGRCAICRRLPVTLRLAVDHDHETGAVRGLLCKRCNRALGMWEGSYERMANLIVYVQKIMEHRKRVA